METQQLNTICKTYGKEFNFCQKKFKNTFYQNAFQTEKLGSFPYLDGINFKRIKAVKDALNLSLSIGNPKVGMFTITWAPKRQYSQSCQFSLVLPM